MRLIGPMQAEDRSNLVVGTKRAERVGQQVDRRKMRQDYRLLQIQREDMVRDILADKEAGTLHGENQGIAIERVDSDASNQVGGDLLEEGR